MAIAQLSRLDIPDAHTQDVRAPLQPGRGLDQGPFAYRHRRRDFRLRPLGKGSGKHVIPTIESRSSPATATSRRWEALPRLSSPRESLMGPASGTDWILLSLA